MTIAAELDMDFLGSTYQFYDEQILTKIKAEFVRPPFSTGNLSFDDLSLDPFEFTPAEKGAFWLWITLVDGMVPQGQEFVIGADIATGTGASNSCLSIGNKKTREKIAEYANPNIMPESFGRLAVATAKFFNNAFMIWEANGPGRIFGKTVINSGYRNIFYRQSEEKITNKKSDVPGWYSTRENKLTLFGEFRRAINCSEGSSEFIVRSERTVQEAREYIYTNTNSVEHAKSLNTIDPTGAGDNHGDMIVADALLWKGLKGQGLIASEEEQEVPIDSLLARRNAYVKKMGKYW
jgi:hypothetical protein